MSFSASFLQSFGVSLIAPQFLHSAHHWASGLLDIQETGALQEWAMRERTKTPGPAKRADRASGGCSLMLGMRKTAYRITWDYGANSWALPTARLNWVILTTEVVKKERINK